MPNGLSNGKHAPLPDDEYFERLTANDPEVCAFIDSGFKLKAYLGASSVEDAIKVVVAFLKAVRYHVTSGAIFVTVSSLDLLEIALPENRSADAYQAFYAGLPTYKRLTRAEREAFVVAPRAGGWLSAQLRTEYPAERIDTRVLTRTAPPGAQELLALYQDAVDCRLLFLATVVCHPRRPDGWLWPFREVNIVDFLTLRMVAEHPDDDGDEDDNEAAEEQS